MITLEQLLESRDRRAECQRSLLSLYPGKALLCLTVMLPGPVKRSHVSLKIASAAVEAVRGAFSPVFEEFRDLETGYEGYFIVDMDPLEAKKLAVHLEETHPLGRLFDLDVILSLKKAVFADGDADSGASSLKKAVFADGVRPLGREELGLEPRTCIICGRPVRECMRTRKHSTEELLSRIEAIIDYNL